jgi:error-prone DNA polymerase
VRLGLREISGLAEAVARRIASARAASAFASVADLAARAALSPAELARLAAADALADLAGHRRQAAWQASGARPQGKLFETAVADEPAMELPPPSEGQALVADYASLGYTLGRHPLTLLRQRLAARRFVPTADLASAPDRKLVRIAGLVTCRQRPGTASGVVFVTLEDETGMANVVVYSTLADRQRRELLGSRLLGVFGQLQREGEVVHVLAKSRLKPSPASRSAQPASACR